MRTICHSQPMKNRDTYPMPALKCLYKTLPTSFISLRMKNHFRYQLKMGKRSPRPGNCGHLRATLFHVSANVFSVLHFQPVFGKHHSNMPGFVQQVSGR